MSLADLRNGVPIGPEIWITLGNIVDVFVATMGIHLLFEGVPHLNSVKALAKYLAVVVILAPFVSGLVGANCSPPSGYWIQWRLWFFADALGFLTLTPAILTWFHEGRAWARKSQNYLEFAGLMTLLSFFGYLTFIATGHLEQPALLYALVPLLLWAALRLGLKGVSTSVIVVAFLSIAGAAHGRGPFPQQGPLDSVLSIQLFLFFAAMPFMFLAVLVLEQKQTAETLRESNDRLRLAMEAGNSVGWDRDVKSGRDSLFGDLQSMFGIPTEAFDGHVEDFHRYLHPGDRGAVLKLIDGAMRTKAPYEAEFRVLWPDGTVRWIAAKGKFYYSPDDEPVRMLGMAVDITDRRLVEEALRESNERLRLAIQTGKMYAFDWDVATDVIIRSEDITHISSLTDEPIRLNKRQFLASVHPEDRAKFNASIAELTPESPNAQISFRLLRPDGSVCWLQRTGHAHFDEQGRIVRMIGMVADVTERKLAEETLSAVSGRLIEAQEKERRRIARELHDDITQRLALLAIDLESLAGISLDSPAQLHNQTEQLIKQTLEISDDVQALSHELHSSKLEYLGLVSALKGFCDEFGGQQKVKIDFTASNVPKDVPGGVSLCLFRIAQEGLRNAVKYSGVRQFEVELWGISGELSLKVRDSGVGFDPEAAVSNRGLGIVSMRERVGLVGGTISIVSKPMGGTEIRVCVPIAAQIGADQKSASA
jgi:PAS domain S-box-containing protein